MTENASRRLRVVSAGAAKGLFAAAADDLARACGVTIEGRYGAVGAMQQALLEGGPCDLVVLTRPMLARLADDGRIERDTIRALGEVRTGLAVRAGEPMPDVSRVERLRANLGAAHGLWVPDTLQSTAGRHVAAMLASLGIADTLRPRLHEFANGATAMADLAASREPLALGCTQVTEILYTPGVTLAGTLPAPYELATTYAIAVAAGAHDRDAARCVIERLAGPACERLRREGGFEGAG